MAENNATTREFVSDLLFSSINYWQVLLWRVSGEISFLYSPISKIL